MTTYQELEQWTTRLAIEPSPAEIHGLMTGWLCAGAAWDAAGRLSALSSWMDQELSKEDVALLETLYDEIAGDLVDEEFGFQPMVPGDDRQMNQRAQEMSAWCSGFLYGFGMTGKFRKEDLSEDVAEVLSDMEKIASMSDDVPEDDENEADLMEINEYVRMSAMLVLSECAQRAVH